MLQETIQTNCLCCNTHLINIARNNSDQLFVLQHKQYQCWKKHFKANVCVVTQVIPMLQETFQSNCLCCNTSHTNVVRNDSDYNTNSWSELFLTTLVWLVLQHKPLVWIVSYNIGMTCVTTQTVGLNCFLQHWYDLCQLFVL